MKISKKMKIIGFSMLGIAITATAIAVPLVLRKDDEKSLSIREKFVNLSKKDILLKEDNNLDLSNIINQTKVIDAIKKRATFLNQKQKDSIKVKTKKGLISYDESLKIEILITLNQKEETFSFKFKRMKNNYDRFYELSKQNQILENETSNLDLSNSLKRDIVKKHIQKQASFLSDQEKNSIEVITNNKTISDSIIQIEINATFLKIKTKFVFKFLRKETAIEKVKNKSLFNSLKTKFDQVDLNSIHNLTNEIDLDLSDSSNQDIVKNFIIGLINAIVVTNVTNDEKKGITIDSTKTTITHTNAVNVDISITFGVNTKIYKFKLTRTISQAEINDENDAKISAIKNKITDVNLTINQDEDTSTNEKILIAIKKQLKIDNPTLLDGELSKITDNISSLIPGTNISVILTITIGSRTGTININVNRPISNYEKIVNYFKTSGNLNIILPKYDSLSNNNEILVSIKKIIKSKNLDENLISIDSSQREITSIPNHGETAINFIIKVKNIKKYTLTLIKKQYSQEETQEIADLNALIRKFNVWRIGQQDLTLSNKTYETYGNNLLNNEGLKKDIIKKLLSFPFSPFRGTFLKENHFKVDTNSGILKRQGPLKIDFTVTLSSGYEKSSFFHFEATHD